MDINKFDAEERPAPGNAPLYLDDPQFVWMVTDGWVDVFALLPGPDGKTGRRIHLFRAEPGDHLFGAAPGVANIRLVAAGAAFAQVRGRSRNEFREALAGVAQPAQFTPLLDRWIQGLTTVATRGRRPPRNEAPLIPGVSRRWKTGEIMAPGRGGVWAPARKELLFLGQDSNSLNSGEGLFPVYSPAWLSASAEIELCPLATQDVLSDPRIWFGLDRFHRLVAEQLARQTAEASREQGERQRRRVSRDERMLGSGLKALTSVDRLNQEDVLLTELDADPLLLACQLIGARHGIIIRNPPGALERAQPGQTVVTMPGWTFAGRSIESDERRRIDPVEAIARTSRARVRRVRLDGDWWRQDNGPILAFRRVDERPIALLPIAPARYDAVDTTTGERKRLTRRDAADLDPLRAFQFFRPFPSQSLTPWRLFFFSLAGTRRDWAWVFILGLVGGVVALFPPIATGWVFDWGIPGAERGNLLLVVLALIAATVAGVLFRLARGVAVLRLETRMDVGTQAGLWDRLLNLSPPFFRRFTVGDLASRMSGIGSIRWLLTDAALSAILNLASSLVYFILLVYYDLALAGLAAGLFATVLGATIYGALKQLPYQREAQHARGQTSGIVLQLLTGLPRLQVADATVRGLAVWAHKFGAQRRQEFHARRVANLMATFASAAPGICTVVLFASVALFPRPELSLGEFLAFNVAFVRLLASALAVNSTIGALIEAAPLYERVRPILDAVPEADAAMTILGDPRGEIEIRRVSFRYQPDSPLVLNDVSIQIRPGEFVAFVGASGAGKSTLLRLLLGFEKPTSGAIFYDRADMTGLDLQSLRRQIGVVLQNVRPLPGTILDSILGAAPLLEEDAWNAARLVGLDDYIRQLPSGMNTVLAELGGDLSGGQRQLLMIARAIACRPRILLFDEATSALDNATQARVSRGLEALSATRVVVAHRLSTVQNADRIIVFDAGRIVEEGTYRELVEKPNGKFSELVRRQQSGENPAPKPL